MMKNGDIYVIGTGLSHDGSACLLKNGSIQLAIEKERLTRRKHDGGNDQVTIDYLLSHAKIKLQDIDLIVQNENFGMFESGNMLYDGISRGLNSALRIESIPHHLAHAYSVLGTCPFDDLAVLVVDGCGNSYDDCDLDRSRINLASIPDGLEHLYFEKDSFYVQTGDKLEPIVKDFSPWGMSIKRKPISLRTTKHSIGGVYRAFSDYVFGDFSDVGKLMGLAALGREKVFHDRLFDLANGRVKVNYDAIDLFRTPSSSAMEFRKRINEFADLAYWVQSEVERALLYLLKHRRESCNARNLGFAGGVALNAVANSKIARRSGFENLYIQPAAGDNGLAIGCAYYGWLQILGESRTKHCGATCFGTTYSEIEIGRAIDVAHDCLERLTIEPESSIQEAAQQLAGGKVVGWFDGRSEFGPRALGNRSILAHPSVPGLRDFINAKVKNREDFRPFAPAVTVEAAHEFFEMGGDESPYMLRVFDVRAEWREKLVNITHEDGTARVQTVDRRVSPRFYRLLKEFERHTGLPMLVNTSFNVRGSPIVESPADAIAMMIESYLEYMYLQGVLVRRRSSAFCPRETGTASYPSEHTLFKNLSLRAVSLTFSSREGGHRSTDVVRQVYDAGRREQSVLDNLSLTLRMLALVDGQTSIGEICDSLDVEQKELAPLIRSLLKTRILSFT